MALPDFTMRQLLEAGVHFGHQTHRWNPKMKSYIYGSRNGIHIIDLAQTVPLLHQALVSVRDTVGNGGRLAVRRHQAHRAGIDRRCGEEVGPVLRELPLARRHAHQLEDHFQFDQAPAPARGLARPSPMSASPSANC